MPKRNINDIRNVALVGHGAAGKTTMADLLLYKSGIGNRAGSVDDKTSLLDTEDEEQDRGFTISSALVHFDHNGKHINLIDTPGYPDFLGQVIGALRATETAVIAVNASAGIEVNTRRTFALAGDAGLGRMILLNKCDMENINFDEVVSGLQETFGQGCVPLNIPVGLGGDFSGVVSTVDIPGDVPAGVVMDPKEINQQVIDAIVESDEELMERYLEGEELSQAEIMAGLSKAIQAGSLIPIFCASSKTGVGVDEFLNALSDCTLAPTQVERKVQGADGEVVVKQASDAPLVAQVFKTRIDPFVSKMSYIRVYAGSLGKDSSVHVARMDKNLKLTQLLRVQGGQNENADEVGAGDIVAVTKMDDLVVGDSLTKDGKPGAMSSIDFPTPMIALAVEPKSRADQQKISGSLHKIEEEDQTFRTTRDSQTKELVMHGMSELHLKVVEDRLKNRDKVEIVTHQPLIPYRETCTAPAEGHYRHKKQSGGSGQFAEVHFRVAPLPQGIDPEEYFTKDRFLSMREYHYDSDLNYAFIDRVTGGSVPNQFIPAAEKGVVERMTQGVLAGYQVQDVSVELYFGKDHPVDSNETAFKMAGSMCFREVFNQAKPVLLEPIVDIEVTVPSDKLGDITSDLNGRRGRVEGMDGAPGGFQVIKAKAPLAEVMTYARALSSMTGGQGGFTMEFSHYEVMPPNEIAKVVEEAKRRKEADES